MMYFSGDMSPLSVFTCMLSERDTGSLGSPAYMVLRLEIKFLAGNHMHFEIWSNMQPNPHPALGPVTVVIMFVHERPGRSPSPLVGGEPEAALEGNGSSTCLPDMLSQRSHTLRKKTTFFLLISFVWI